MKDIKQCACGIAQDVCDYHKLPESWKLRRTYTSPVKEVLGQPDFKLRWTERDYKAIRNWEDVINAATLAELELAKNDFDNRGLSLREQSVSRIARAEEQWEVLVLKKYNN